MNKLYNTEEDIVKEIIYHINKIDMKFSKPQLKVLPHILVSIIKSENITACDISKNYIDDSLLTNDSSIQKKIWRFLNNPKFDGMNFFNKIIKKVLHNLKSIKHDKLVVCIDHMYVHNKFVNLVFSLKVGKQSIPILFLCDKSKSNDHYEIDDPLDKKLFSQKVIFDAIDYVIDLLSPLNTKIIFLADRWFCNLKIMEHIQLKHQFFCFRAKVNSSIRFFLYDKKEKHKIFKRFTDLPIQKHHALYYENVEFGAYKFKCNLSIARGKLSDDPWFILSNIQPNTALKEYAHRFGSIETLFKNQKSNGFNLEKTKIKNLHAYENLYSLVCIACTWLTIIGSDYTKNYNSLKNKLNIRFVKQTKSKQKIRILSLFNLGLTIFKKVYSSYIDFKLKCNMQLYLWH